MRMSDCWLECKPSRNSNLPLTDLRSVGLIPRSFALGKRLYERALRATKCGQVAQLVEQRTENPRVGGSIPPLATKHAKAPMGPFVFVERANSPSSIDSDRPRPILTLRAG